MITTKGTSSPSPDNVEAKLGRQEGQRLDPGRRPDNVTAKLGLAAEADPGEGGPVA